MARPSVQQTYPSVTRTNARRAAVALAEVAPAPNEQQDRIEKNAQTSLFNRLTGTRLKRGHTLSYVGLFVFTLVLYARPSDFYPSALTNSLALIIALAMLAFFIPTQLSLEGNVTAMLPEVRFVLLYGLIGLVGVPLAISRAEAWQEFSGVFIRCIIVFVVLVNVVRTDARLRALFYLSLATAVWLSVGAINDYRLGLLTVEGYRVGGYGGGIFGNSNDMALYLVTMVPVAVAFLLRTKNIAVKAIFAATTLLMISAIMFTYSRGGFLGLVAALAFLGWRLGNRHRAQILTGGLLLVIAFLVLSPGGYGVRLASIIFPSLDPKGSADVRRGDLARSLYVALRHPLLGIGMGNYASQMSFTGLVTHNSYTQVAAEMGLAALYCYTMFILGPLRKLGRIARETFDTRAHSPFHYMAVGLQAALIGYIVCSFFASVAYLWYVFYLAGYAVCLRRLYEAETGREVVLEKRADRKKAALARNPEPLTT